MAADPVDPVEAAPYPPCDGALPEASDGTFDDETIEACGPLANFRAGAAWALAGADNCLQFNMESAANGLASYARSWTTPDDEFEAKWDFVCGGEAGPGVWLTSATIGLESGDDGAPSTVRWDPPILWVPAEYDAPGVVWTGTTTFSEDGEEQTAVWTYQTEVYPPEEIQTVAGTFDAVHVEVTQQDDGTHHDIWYAPDVGIVEFSYCCNFDPVDDAILVDWRDGG